jgi:hypothetical protein
MSTLLYPGFDLADSKHEANAVLRVLIVVSATALLTVTLRLYVRHRNRERLKVEDYITIFALVRCRFSVPIFTFAILTRKQLVSFIGITYTGRELQYGLGRHVYYVIEERGYDGYLHGVELSETSQFGYMMSSEIAKSGWGVFLWRKPRSIFMKYALYTLWSFMALMLYPGYGTYHSSPRKGLGEKVMAINVSQFSGMDSVVLGSKILNCILSPSATPTQQTLAR